VEAAEACAGIVAGVFFGEAYVLKAEEAFEERVQGNGLVTRRNRAGVADLATVTLAAPDDGAFKAELKIACRLEADLFHVDPWLVRVGMSFEAAYKKFVSEGAGEPG